MEIKVGAVVRCTAGHDKGELHFVYSVENSTAMLVDGKGRRAEKPKKKNLRHVTVVMQQVEGVSERILGGEKVPASEVRKILSQIAAQNN